MLPAKSSVCVCVGLFHFHFHFDFDFLFFDIAYANNKHIHIVNLYWQAKSPDTRVNETGVSGSLGEANQMIDFGYLEIA